jgi:hypothetical protein
MSDIDETSLWEQSAAIGVIRVTGGPPALEEP